MFSLALYSRSILGTELSTKTARFSFYVSRGDGIACERNVVEDDISGGEACRETEEDGRPHNDYKRHLLALHC